MKTPLTNQAIKMEGGQSGPYLRLTKASSGPQVTVAKTYSIEMKTNISAFLSSRIQFLSDFLSINVMCAYLEYICSQMLSAMMISNISRIVPSICFFIRLGIRYKHIQGVTGPHRQNDRDDRPCREDHFL